MQYLKQPAIVLSIIVMTVLSCVSLSATFTANNSGTASNAKFQGNTYAAMPDAAGCTVSTAMIDNISSSFGASDTPYANSAHLFPLTSNDHTSKNSAAATTNNTVAAGGSALYSQGDCGQRSIVGSSSTTSTRTNIFGDSNRCTEIISNGGESRAAFLFLGLALFILLIFRIQKLAARESKARDIGPRKAKGPLVNYR